MNVLFTISDKETNQLDILVPGFWLEDARDLVFDSPLELVEELSEIYSDVVLEPRNLSNVQLHVKLDLEKNDFTVAQNHNSEPNFMANNIEDLFRPDNIISIKHIENTKSDIIMKVLRELTNSKILVVR